MISSTTQQDDDQVPLQELRFKTLKRRWYMLLICGLMGTLQAAVWDGWSTITNAAFYAYPNWDNSTIALLGNWGEICYLIGVAPLTWLIQTKGIRISALVCVLMIAAGTGIRCIQTIYIHHKHSGTIFKILAHIGGILNGTAGVCVCVIPSVISALWFPPGQRTTATGISWVMLEFGNAFGFLFGPLLVPNPPESDGKNDTTSNPTIFMQQKFFHGDRIQMRYDIMNMMYSHFGAAMVLLICIIIYFPKKPPVAPSPTSELQRESFRDGVKQILRNRSMILLVIAYSLSQGIQEGFMPVLNIDFTPLGIKEDKVGWLGFWSSIASCIAAFLSGHFADRLTGHFKSSILILLGIATLSFIWMGLICMKVIPFSLVQIYASVILGFAANFACTPLFFELAAEISYPVGEGVVAGFMTFWWTVIGIIFLSVFFIKNIGYIWMNWCLLLSTFVSIPLVMGIKEEFHRSDADDRIIQEQQDNICSAGSHNAESS